MPQERKPDVGLGHETPRGAVAHIGKSVLVRGELSGSEDLYIDGQVEGTIELREHNLTVGPNGRVDANVNAKEVILLGTVKGNIRAVERVEIRKSGSLVGDLVAARVIIEDGAYFKGSIDIQKAAEPAPKPAEVKRTEVPVTGDAHKYAAVPVEAKKLH
ncbi:MAG: polymer-forming cytoskeletal protein [Acidobacteria bacterium]|nr:polymer-forming cytoskeletal protein [Acidobacteriota bacterium]